MPPSIQGQNVFITRLHLRYDQAHFPEDLAFQETGDRSNFQGRYILRHAWQGGERCPAAERYLSEELPRRRNQEAQNLALLTGWDLNEIRNKMKLEPARSKAGQPWWKSLWKDE
jgi:hypothetical protein